jgi:hypothetical protein
VTSRKEAIRAYKERKPCRGAFAIRCTVTSQVWVGSSPNVDTASNGIFFRLRHGGYPDATLQAQWNEHGEGAFVYEVLDKLADDVSEYEVKDALRGKKTDWAARLGARVLF